MNGGARCTTTARHLITHCNRRATHDYPNITPNSQSLRAASDGGAAVKDPKLPADELSRRIVKLSGAKLDAITLDIAADELQRISEFEQRQQDEAELKAKVVQP
jgi:hypothetical protein